MKRLLVVLAMLIGVAGAAQAQTRVGVSLSFGDPYVHGQVVVGRPYYHRYSRPYYHRYRPYYRSAPVIVVAPRHYRAPRVVVVAPRRHHHRRW
jgi:hypothetical protein